MNFALISAPFEINSSAPLILLFFVDAIRHITKSSLSIFSFIWLIICFSFEFLYDKIAASSFPELFTNFAIFSLSLIKSLAMNNSGLEAENIS